MSPIKNTKKSFFHFFKTTSFIVIIALLTIGGLITFAVNFPGLTHPAWQVTGGKFQNTFNNISVANGCGTDRYLQWFTSTGVLICKSITTFPTLVTSPNPISNYAITGSGLYAQYLKNILNDCGNGRYVRGFDENKQMICSDKNGDETTIGINITSPLNISFPSAPAIENYTMYFSGILSNDCGDQRAITGFSTTNFSASCADMNVPVSASCTGLPANAVWNSVSTITQIWNGTEYTPSTSGSYDEDVSTSSCVYKCNTNYEWDGDSCTPSNTPGLCTGLPANAVWNSVSTITQTWNGTAWIPTKVGSYNMTASTTNCSFKCKPNYTWNTTQKKCNPDTKTYACNAKPAIGTVWNSVTSYTQTWNGTTWLPASDTSTNYTTTASTTSCRYKCATNYTWDSTLNKCVINGQCGGANGDILTVAPTTNLCLKWADLTPTVYGSGPWTWTCAGVNGGDNVSCRATDLCNSLIAVGDLDFQGCNSITNAWKNYDGTNATNNGAIANSTATDSNGWRYGALYNYSTIDNACPAGNHSMTSSEAMYAYKKLGSNWNTVRTTLKIPYAGAWDTSTSHFGYRGTSAGIRFEDNLHMLLFVNGSSPSFRTPWDANNGISARCIKNDPCYTVPATKITFNNPLYNSNPIWIGMGVNANDASLGDARVDPSAKRTLGTAWCKTKWYDCGITTAYQWGFNGNAAVYNPVTKTWVNDSDNDHVNATQMACWNPGMANGQCGSADGDIVGTKPTTGLCSKWTATAVTGSGPWTWKCTGINGGTTDSCSAKACWISTVTAWWFTYSTKLWPDWKCWTSSNMKHIPSSWNSWCYGDVTTNCTNYGRLYNWTTAKDSSLCWALWKGWTLPTDVQWTNIVNNWATGWLWNKLYWMILKLPGYRTQDWWYAGKDTYGSWWSSTESTSGSRAWQRDISSQNSDVARDTAIESRGFSVMCINN